MMRFKKTNTFFCFILLVMVVVSPGQAWALQSHGAPEGSYTHQLAHVFFFAALCYLFWDIRRSIFHSKAWRFLQIFCVFMVLWNLMAFTGHWVEGFIDPADFVAEDGYMSDKIVGPLNFVKLVYYCAKLDHVFSVLAMFCLYLCLRTLYRQTSDEENP